MMKLHSAADRGHANHGWLDSHHSFSFADYYDPEHMGFRDLRVINEDRVIGGAGFPTHPHRDMEIISYVVEGALEHRDSMGNGSIIRPGDVQRMTAGRGVTHSEFNHSQTAPLRFLQIWIQPNVRALEPGYEQKAFTDESRSGVLRLVASPDQAEGSVKIHQDARLYSSLLKQGDEVRRNVAKDRHVWLQIIEGKVRANGHELSPGDGASLSGATELHLESIDPSHFLLFDLS